MKLTLYYAPIACSLVPLVTLHESGAKFEVKPISLKDKQQHNAEYLRINPKAKVPVLVVDGEPLTENVAILTWLASAFPAKKLLPTDPKNSIKALSLMSWCASGLHPPDDAARQRQARARLRAGSPGSGREGDVAHVPKGLRRTPKAVITLAEHAPKKKAGTYGRGVVSVI